jgi:magnesium-transporting ATPase (P-type)
MVNYTTEIVIKLITIINLGFIVILYLLLAFFFSKLIDKIEEPDNLEIIKKKPIYMLILEIILFFWIVSIILYIVWNITPMIPFPLDGIMGYDHLKVKELHLASLFTFILFFLQKNYKLKLDYVYSKIL